MKIYMDSHIFHKHFFDLGSLITNIFTCSHDVSLSRPGQPSCPRRGTRRPCCRHGRRAVTASPRPRRAPTAGRARTMATSGTTATLPTTRRACGVPTSSRASRRRWPSTLRVGAARSSCQTRARCMVGGRTDGRTDGWITIAEL